MTGLTPDYRHRTTLQFSRALMIIMVIGSIARVFIPYLPDFVIWLGFINVALAAIVYLVIRSKRLLRYESLIVVSLCFIYVYPLFLTTGGVNSQYVYFMTLIPMVAALVGSVRMTWAVCVIQMLLVLLMFMWGDRIPDLTGYPFIEDKTRVRSVWLMVGIFIASYFGVYFRKAYDEQSVLLDKLASIDHLTGLLNRRGLKVRLDQELLRCARSGQPLSVLMMDVDYFKQFNDQYGHAAGDDCLIKLAQCLRKHTRAEDIVSRYGGEEFLIVLTNADINKALTAAEKLRQSIAELDCLEGGVRVSVTIGAASMAPATPRDELPEAEVLIRNADAALYRGKEAGRNRVEYSGGPADDPVYA